MINTAYSNYLDFIFKIILCIAFCKGHIEKVKILLEREGKDTTGWAPLILGIFLIVIN